MDKSLIFTGALCALAPSVANAAEDSRPNVIVILADDLGYADVGFTGAKDIRTPNLDKLAESGVIFTNGHCNHPFSGPSRAAILSGRYQQRFGFETNPAYDPMNPFVGISIKEKLFPERLQEVGYTTGAIGKWHLGASEIHNPLNRGFDFFYGFLGGGHEYFEVDRTQRVGEAYRQGLIHNTDPVTFRGYLTDVFSEQAVNFVNDNKDEPFFLYVAYHAPHTPLQAPEEDIARYSDIEYMPRRIYAAMVDVMDRGVGQIVEALRENGIYENTIIFFSSDNGGPRASEHDGPLPFADNSPFKETKGSTYEGGHHVPFIMSWPAKVKEGMEYKYPVNHLDISRTAVEVAGADAMVGPDMEGVDLIPFITGEQDGAPHEAIFWRNGPGWAVLRSDGMKQLSNRNSGVVEQFNVYDDPSETTNLLGQDEQCDKELRGLWDEWNDSNMPIVFLDYKNYHVKLFEMYKSLIPESTRDEVLEWMEGYYNGPGALYNTPDEYNILLHREY